MPAVPRKSSRRAGSFANSSDTGSRERSRLPVIPSSPNDPRTREATNLSPDWPLTQRLPFGVLDHSPDRNHHRSPSNNSAISAISAVSSQSNQHESQPSGHRQKEPAAPSAFGPPAFREDRPSSMGYVQQHRASDHIHNPDIHVISGSSAELVEG